MKKVLVFESEYWSYVPLFIDSSYFEKLLKEVDDLAVTIKQLVYNKVCDTPRKSCLFSKKENMGKANTSVFDRRVSGSYGSDNFLPTYNWKKSPTLFKIKEEIEEFFETHYDYCLLHIYRNGNDYIAYHNDKEALKTDVASVSLGATRKFRFRRLGEKSGFYKEIELKSGDVLLMHGPVGDKDGCQKKFVHSVPKQLRIKEPRINLTFRKNE